MILLTRSLFYGHSKNKSHKKHRLNQYLNTAHFLIIRTSTGGEKNIFLLVKSWDISQKYCVIHTILLLMTLSRSDSTSHDKRAKTSKSYNSQPVDLYLYYFCRNKTQDKKKWPYEGSLAVFPWVVLFLLFLYI